MSGRYAVQRTGRRTAQTSSRPLLQWPTASTKSNSAAWESWHSRCTSWPSLTSVRASSAL